eukprot:TRINITY_DN2337_c0_g1_i17.p2 TRINITY_DN2337_c0_g1~~TRINITY_DN2337_c0_g1_i17.p2  ORF type:complete len:148 (-),score=17.48 TRINITY_DN2337_c0_g1_i17:263-706(-)
MNDKIENIQKNLLNLMNLRAKYKCTLMIQVQEWKITCEKLLTKVPQELIVNLKISNRMISIGANSDQKELANYFEDDVSNETVAGQEPFNQLNQYNMTIHALQDSTILLLIIHHCCRWRHVACFAKKIKNGTRDVFAVYVSQQKQQT